MWEKFPKATYSLLLQDLSYEMCVCVCLPLWAKNLNISDCICNHQGQGSPTPGLWTDNGPWTICDWSANIFNSFPGLLLRKIATSACAPLPHNDLHVICKTASLSLPHTQICALIIKLHKTWLDLWFLTNSAILQAFYNKNGPCDYIT